MQRVSSNWTLVLKIFFPTFWIAFFGAFTLAVLFTQGLMVPGMSLPSFRLGLVFFFLLGLLVQYLTLMRLKRVEFDDDFVYVSNYFKNFKYPYHNIRMMKESRFLTFYTASIHFNVPGHFGRQIFFIQSRPLFKAFFNKHPQWKEKLAG